MSSLWWYVVLLLCNILVIITTKTYFIPFLLDRPSHDAHFDAHLVPVGNIVWTVDWSVAFRSCYWWRQLYHLYSNTTDQALYLYLFTAPVCQATKSDTCGGNISSDTVIRSPTSTDTFDYPPNQVGMHDDICGNRLSLLQRSALRFQMIFQDCTWNVTAPAGFQIHVTFLCYFLLSPPESGGEDYLIITSSEGTVLEYVT